MPPLHPAHPHAQLDPNAPPPLPPPPAESSSAGSPTANGSKASRQLSNSKRAEQNRKAQRAFRERRDAKVRELEQRSALLDSALASADEANRRWEECRALVDQLRVENAALRAALTQAQMANAGVVVDGKEGEDGVAVGGDGE
ncbi:unnamed protein product [Peniophora sp. CBMAI 1063]|nr:unnamed protein product [Peniophora sp. CBMAI 1063]